MELKSTLEQILSDLGVFSSEIILVAGSVILLMLGLLKPFQKYLKMVTVLIFLAGLFSLGNFEGSFFKDFVQIDALSNLLKPIFLSAGLLLAVFPRKSHQLEFYFIAIGVVVGSMFMVSVKHLLLIYLSVELTSYAAYLLTGLNFREKSGEAAIKYLLFGGASSAVMLFGISLIYGATGTLHLDLVEDSVLQQVGIVMLFGGILFKASIFPFHLWVPSTYEEAPNDVVALLSVIPKLAGFGLLYHVISSTTGATYDLLSRLLILLALITVIWGTLSALLQKSIKRLVAYGAIAHSGFMLPFFLLPDDQMISGFGYYALVYAMMGYAIFFFIGVMEEQIGKALKLEDLDGLGAKNAFFGVLMVIVLISLIGLPPTGGFTAKLVLFSEVWINYGITGSGLWLTFFIIGILSTVAALFFYLQIPYHMFLKSSNNSVVFKKIHGVAATFFAIALLILFLYPDILDNI